jgi:hypothetical protein
MMNHGNFQLGQVFPIKHYLNSVIKVVPQLGLILLSMDGVLKELGRVLSDVTLNNGPE